MTKDTSPLSPGADKEALANLMKRGMRQWASGVTVLAARDSAGEPHAMTASSLTSVSDAPPSLLVCVNANARMASIVNAVGTPFSVNVLGSQHQAVSNACATPDMYDRRFTVGDWDAASTTPRLVDASAVFECEVAEVVPYGTHLVVIGKISNVILNESPVAPLLYWNGGYKSLAD